MMDSGNLTSNGTDNHFCKGKLLCVWIQFSATYIIALVSIAGNMLVIAVISKSRSLHTTTSVFIVTLSVSDLCTSLAVMLPSGIAIVTTTFQSYEESFCNFLGFCYIQFRMASILALTSISIERFTAIQVPLKYATLVTRRRTIFSVFLIWIFPCLMATMPYFVNHNYVYSTAKGLCVPKYQDHLWYTIIILGAGVCIPLFITLIMYFFIARVALQQARRGILVCDENHCQYIPSRKGELKAVKTLFAITGVSFLCWLPYTTTNLWSTINNRVINTHWDISCEILTFLSASLNPCMYSLLNRSFRQALVKQYKKCDCLLSCCLRQRDKSETGYTSKVSKAPSAAVSCQRRATNDRELKQMSIVSISNA